VPIIYMKQIQFCEGYASSAGQKVACLSQNSEVHYCVHKSKPLVPILDQMDLVHVLPLFSFMIYFNTILPSMLRSPK
jgi:hypothetical protein